MVPRFAYPYRQRGAIGLMAAITLGMALLFMLLVIDSGRLYLEQRKLQRVVDAAALEASNLNAVCSGTGVNALTQATTSAARNGLTVGTGNTLTVTCGTLSTGSNNLRAFTANATATQAIQVVANETVATSVAAGLWGMVAGGGFNANTVLRATATAGYVGGPLAQLTIRSTLASISSAQSPLLNALFGGILGGSLNLSAAQYSGLLNTNINLLNYLNQAAIAAHITAGDYTTLLNTSLNVTTLVDAAATVASQNGAGVDIKTTLAQISALGNSTTLKLGDLIQTTTGSANAGLNGTVQLLQLVQGIIEVAGSGKAVDISGGVNLGALANLSLKVGIIEPPQISAIGNPALATLDPKGTNKIYVNTAQARILISFQSSLLNSVISTALDSINLIGSLTCLAGTCPSVPNAVMPNTSIDLGILAASGDAYVTNYSCQGSNKILTVDSEQSAATIIIGSINPTTFFSSATSSTNSPLTLLDVGTQNCTRTLLSLTCNTRTPSTIGTLTLGGSVSVASGSGSYTFSPTPNIGQTPLYKSFTTTNIVTNLGSNLANLTLINWNSTNLSLGSLVLGLLTSAIKLLLNGATSALVTVLGTVLDPVINSLLSLLGLDLANIDVGANLTCQTGRAQLVL